MKKHVTRGFTWVPLAALALATALPGSTAGAGVPGTLNFEGVLKEGGGLVNGVYDVDFAIWDVESGGDPAVNRMWGPETHSGIPIDNGVLIRSLGFSSPLDHTVFSEADRWLEVQLTDSSGKTTTLPRIKLSSTPYTYRIGTVDGAQGGDVEGTVRITDGSFVAIELDENSTDGGAAVRLYNSASQKTIRLDADDDDAAEIELRNDLDEVTVEIDASASESGHDSDSRLILRDAEGNSAIRLHSDKVNDAPEFSMFMTNSTDSFETVEIVASDGSGPGQAAKMLLRRPTDSGTAVTTVSIDAHDDNRDGGSLMTLSNENHEAILLDADDNDDAARIVLKNSLNEETVVFDASSPSYPDDGVVFIRDQDANPAIRLHADIRFDGPEISLFKTIDGESGTFKTVQIASADGAEPEQGGQIVLRRLLPPDAEDPASSLESVTTLELVAADETDDRLDGGRLEIFNGDGKSVFSVRAHSFAGLNRPEMTLEDGISRTTFTPFAIHMYSEGDTSPSISLNSTSGAVSAEKVVVFDPAGVSGGITLDPNYEGRGCSRTITDVLEITGGCDLSEQFDIDGLAKPGTLVSIDPARPGRLTLSKQAYDSRVAGIISGAGGIRPGMMMGQSGSLADGQHPVALTGRVYCWADASNGAIQPGDLLTTSATAGHAMKVTDETRAYGAIIGKAMTSLEAGTGLVLVLVSLQ